MDFFTENHLSGCNLVDPDLNGGEINIKVPSEAFNQNMIGEGKPLKVRVEFSLEDPKVWYYLVMFIRLRTFKKNSYPKFSIVQNCIFLVSKSYHEIEVDFLVLH